jgi:pimeloyl-ACP methyl ester carboxylesterase
MTTSTRSAPTWRAALTEPVAGSVAGSSRDAARRKAVVLWAVTLLIALGACTGPSVPARGTSVPGTPAASAPDGAAPAVEEGSVPVEGGTIHYTRAGSGPPLLLLHGWPETSHAWHKTLPELAGAYTVIALDLPGLGESSIPAGGYDKVTTARRVREAVQRLGYREIMILAHDVGAMVGFSYAREFPTEVARLAVMESLLPGPTVDKLNQVTWHVLFNATRAPIPEELVDDEDVPTYLGMFFEGTLPPADREPYYQAYADPARRHAGYEYYRAFSADAEDVLAHAESKRLPMPVLAVGATRSLGGLVAESFRPAVGDIREVLAPDSSHFIPEENPRFVIDCARLFFSPGAAGPTPARPELADCVG